MKLKRFTTQLAAAGLIALPLMAHAAGLGKLSVTSALGQPLAAEIELLAADKAELDSLAASLASEQSFRDARVEYAPVLSTLHFTVERKANGKAVLKVTSSRPVNDPFIDMLVELNWASGRLVREYTVLLDPPGAGGSQTVAPVAISQAQTSPVHASSEKPAQAAPGPVAEQAASPRAPADTVRVKKGDTLSGIARRVRPEGMSLERTLVGLYRENTQAFVGNMNSLKAGKTLKVPSAETIAAISPKEASREIRLQADDWHAYRQKLAEAVRKAPAAHEKAEPGQAASGKITSKVEDRAKPASEAPKDVLKLSKVTPPTPGVTATPTGKAAEIQAQQDKLREQEEDATAREKALKESGDRVSVLEKQIQDMHDLVQMKEKAAQPAPAASAPVVNVPVPAPVPAENWYDPLLNNPLYWGGGAAAIGLGGLLWWMVGGGRRRKPIAAFEDSVMTGDEVRPNTVMGAASGGSINTGDTSFLTDFSQAGLGTIDTHDVDPIAEAEVYMAYGRDAQAEEILREAIIKNPDRHEIRLKLLEIYAARRNTTAFEKVAGQIYAALGGSPSVIWDRAAEMGRSIDPANPLYGGAQSALPDVVAPAATTIAATTEIAGGAMAFDTRSGIEKIAEEPVTASAPMEFETAGHILEFDAKPETSGAPASGFAEVNTQGLDFDLSSLDVPADADQRVPKFDLDYGDGGDDIEFDFSGLDLDLGDTTEGNEVLDEIGTKLDLARAYLEMGDKEGAHEILQEVMAEGSDKQKTDAQGMLSSLA